MNYYKIKRSSILFLIGICAITSLSCNDNDNGGYPERVPTRLSVMPLPERVDYKEAVVNLPQSVTVSQSIPASILQLLKSTLEDKLSLSVNESPNDNAFIRVKQESDLASRSASSSAPWSMTLRRRSTSSLYPSRINFPSRTEKGGSSTRARWSRSKNYRKNR